MTAYGVLARFPLQGNTEVNAELLRTRLWYDDDKTKELQLGQLRQVAAAAKNVPAGLLDALHGRRRAAARALAERRQGHGVRAVLIRPRWRVVVGHGEDSPHETSLSFSSTYGLPMWPASGLKGVTAAYARDANTPDDEVDRIFGSPRPGSSATVDAHRGGVTVFDALPAEPPHLEVDVLTPHVMPYYQKAMEDPKNISQPPAEYHNPVPVRFLAVAGTPFRTFVIGPHADVERFVGLLTAAADDLGLGGKTAAGYGYCTVVEERE